MEAKDWARPHVRVAANLIPSVLSSGPTVRQGYMIAALSSFEPMIVVTTHDCSYA